MTLDDLLAGNPFEHRRAEKWSYFLPFLQEMEAWHRQRCAPYAHYLDYFASGFPSYEPDTLEGRPYLPVQMFKRLRLQSVPDEEVFKLLTSSGTSGGAVSRIALDREATMQQAKTLALIGGHFLGKKRLPMIVVDSSSSLAGGASMNARGAGALGLSNFGRDHFHLLDERLEPDRARLDAYLEKHGEGPYLIFGLTYLVWEKFYKALRGLKFPGSVLVHGGGWKKLQFEAVDNAEFKRRLGELGIERVHNYYGMVEQVGSIYFECAQGYFHTSNFSEVLVRRSPDWQCQPVGQEGVIQTLSLLPRSYPGHNLLTEDLGTVHGVDDCPCGLPGTRFTIQGRVPQAELRGCSDVLEVA